MLDSIVVGAGIAGATLARRLAEEKNENVLVVERKQFVGGYAYDYRNREGILIHQFGPHIFRTNNKEVYKFLSRFTDWIDYQHKVLAYVEGNYYPMPINLDTVNNYLGTNYTVDTVLTYFDKVKTHPSNKDNIKDAVESQIGERFYKAFFENYTAKQWGSKPENLPSEIISRIPIRNNKDDRYFSSKYQVIPSEGYTRMIEKLLLHPKIKVLLNADYCEVKNYFNPMHVYYSGSIDEYFNYSIGKLPYRCVNFEFEEYDQEYYQPVSVVNYPNDYDYTRITEFKHFTNHKCKHTVIAKEYSGAEGDSSYPIPIEKNKNLYHQYELLNTNKNVIFIGRLGRYKYYSMDQIVDEILEMQL